MFGCGGSTQPPNSTANANTKKENSNNPLETTKAPAEQTTNNAPTMAAVYTAFCDAWVKNDETALRRVYSSAAIREFETDMKEEKEKSLIKFLEPTDKVSGNPCEVTNEKITGDTAVARVRSSKYPNGISVVFLKENGEWKLTNKSATLDTVKQSTTNSNTVK